MQGSDNKARFEYVNKSLNRAIGRDENHNFDEESLKKVDQHASAAATKAFSHFLGADQFVLVGEVGWSMVHDLPAQTELRLEAPGTYTSGNLIFQTARVQPGTEPASAFPTEDAWGYVIAGRFDFNNAIGAVNISPRFSWAHDVSGISPGPGGNFIEGRKALA